MRYVVATALAVAMAALPAHAKVLRYSTNADLLGLDPAINNEGPTNAMKTNLYEGLLSRNFDLSLSPALATEYSQVSPEVWRFKLRQGVKFHDGTPFVAEDVAFSVGRYNAEQSDMKGYTATIKEVKVVDPQTIDIHTNGPDPILPQQLPLFFIMSKSWAEKNNTAQVVRGTSAPTFINFNANGTGPYKLVERVADNRTVVEPNPNWWGKLDNGITRAEFRPIANAATRVAALLSGEIDLMYPVPSQDKQRINTSKGTKVLEGPELRTIFLGFDQHRNELLDMKGSGKNPFKDKRVREAFYKAIDIQTIARVVMRGESRPTGSMVAPGIAGFSDDVDKRPAFNPDEAKKLLADAGYPNGFPVTLDCPNDRYTNDEAICQAVVPMLTRVGIQIKLNAQTRSLHFDKIGLKENRNTSFYMLGWTPGTFDAHNMLVNIVTMDGPGAGQNNSGAYRNPKVEELTLKAGTEMDPKKRTEMLVEAQKIHKDDYGHIPLHQQTLAWGVRDEVIDGSVKPRPSNDVELKLIKMK